MIILSCDMVMEGAFFPQSDFQVPQKKVGHDRGQHVLVPSTEFSNLVMVQAQFSFCFFKALFDCPAQSGEPNKTVQPGANRSIADKIIIFKFIIDPTPPDDKPYLFSR